MITGCPCCLSTDTKIFIKNIEKEYSLLQCNACGVIYADPFREPDAAFYTNASDVASENRHSKINPFPAEHPANKCPQLQNGQGKKLLDLGCGNGSFISFAEKNGFECYGLDIDQTSINAAKTRNLQARFENGFLNDLEQISGLPKKYDVITMFEVFEHIDTPLKVISKIKSLLNDGGYFIGSLPNIERFRMWTHNMNYERPPYHLTYWTANSWTNFIKRNGFGLVSIANNIYFGYISDVLANRSRSSGIGRSFFTATKYFIEAPIEKLMKNGASFFFVLKNNG